MRYVVGFAAICVSALATAMARMGNGLEPSWAVSFIATAGLYLAYQAGRLER